MGRITDPRRIVVEEFKKEDQETVERIADSYNSFVDQVTQTLNGNVDFSNLSRSLITYDVVVDSNGVPTSGGTKISTNLSYVTGVNVVKFDNLSSTSSKFTSLPGMHFTYSGSGIIKVNYITNLTAGIKYRLILEFIK